MSEYDSLIKRLRGSLSTSWPLLAAALFTALFGAWVFYLSSSFTIQEGITATRWDHFLNSRPNELGDTLAGVVGSLTLIWIIASVFQQNIELKAQGRELATMATSQREQAQKIEADRLRYLSEGILEGCIDKMTSEPLSSISWTPVGYYKDIDFDEDGTELLFKPTYKEHYASEEISIPPDAREVFFKSQNRHLSYLYAELERSHQSGPVRFNTIDKDETEWALTSLLSGLGRLVKLYDDLNAADRERLENLKVQEVFDRLRMIVGMKQWWHETAVDA